MPDDRTLRAVIRDEALRLFAEHGPGAVSVRQIAAAAGVSPGLIVHHFGSKDGLRDAVDQYVLAVFDRMLGDMSSGRPDLFDAASSGSVAEEIMAHLPAGSPVLTYGNSTIRLGVETLRPKAGTTAGTVGGGFAHEMYTVSPGIPGDSGSGYLTGKGEALGLLSTLNLAPLPVSNGVTDLAHAMRYAAGHGFADLELEPGTEPFTPKPAALLPSRLPRL